MARKTTTSAEVRHRWEAANYQMYVVRLRKDTDAELIELVEAHKDKFGTTEIFRQGLEKIKKEGLN